VYFIYILLIVVLMFNGVYISRFFAPFSTYQFILDTFFANFFLVA